VVCHKYSVRIIIPSKPCKGPLRLRYAYSWLLTLRTLILNPISDKTLFVRLIPSGVASPVIIPALTVRLLQACVQVKGSRKSVRLRVTSSHSISVSLRPTCHSHHRPVIKACPGTSLSKPPWEWIWLYFQYSRVQQSSTGMPFRREVKPLHSINGDVRVPSLITAFPLTLTRSHVLLTCGTLPALYTHCRIRPHSFTLRAMSD
jgi:hypothetical protein